MAVVFALVGGFFMGMGLVMMIPPEYEDRLRGWIVKQWQKITKKG